jgi:hypothetical protein
VARITAGDHVSRTRTARSAFLAVGPRLIPQSSNGGETGIDWREPPTSSYAPSAPVFESTASPTVCLVDYSAGFRRGKRWSPGLADRGVKVAMDPRTPIRRRLRVGSRAVAMAVPRWFLLSTCSLTTGLLTYTFLLLAGLRRSERWLASHSIGIEPSPCNHPQAAG